MAVAAMTGFIIQAIIIFAAGTTGGAITSAVLAGMFLLINGILTAFLTYFLQKHEHERMRVRDEQEEEKRRVQKRRKRN